LGDYTIGQPNRRTQESRQSQSIALCPVLGWWRRSQPPKATACPGILPMLQPLPWFDFNI